MSPNDQRRNLFPTKGNAMLGNPTPPPLTPLDHQAFGVFVPLDHHLRKAQELIPWDELHEELADAYSPDQGRPSEPPVLMLKLLYLAYHYNLSDREVIERARTDLAFRWFLQVDMNHRLVDPSSLCYFRARLGADGFKRVFNRIVACARKHGLVKERLRIKDASHILGDIDVPSTLALVAQIRDKLLATAEPFDPLRVKGERIALEVLREQTKGKNNEQRLVARVAHLREILAWADELLAPEEAGRAGTKTNRLWQTFLVHRDLAHKILADQENPKAGDLTRSTVDPEARRAKHGDWYDGYQLDIIVDADSEIITQINVLPANGDEAADAVELIRQEEVTHGNDIERLSIDGAGFNGPVLRELEDPEGLAVDTYVPPKKEPETEFFTPEVFVHDADQDTVTCPAGERSSYRQRNDRDTATMYRFKQATCAGCGLASQCMANPPKKGPFGRTVRKNDYEEEYRRARQKATTEEYASIRQEHFQVERKLGEVMNRHGGRRARYRGHKKILIQELMACTATNVKRILRLVCALANAC